VLAGVLLLGLLSHLCLAADLPRAESPVVESIECNDNISMSCEAIRTRSGITTGRELDEREIESARLRLESLPNVRAVHIHLIKGSRRQRVVVVIDVTEASPLTTAFAAGTLLQVGSQARLETLAGRITDHDLFGSAKVLDLAVVGAWPIAAGGGQEYAARLEYVDPQLFGSRRYFLSVGGFYSQAAFNFSIPTFFAGNGGYQNSGAGFDFSVGMHLGTYMYVTGGYRYLYLQNTASNSQYLTSDGVITTLSSSPGSVALFTVGRNTEDDPAFPTRGWLLHAYGAIENLHNNFAGVVVRGTWRAGAASFWTFQARPFDDFRSLFDDDLGISIVYSHALSSEFQSGTVRRGRWYVGPGVTNLTNLNNTQWNRNYELGLKAGVRLETRYFGTVNFYVIVSGSVHGWY
jgi:outer membrane protein assembly factor BamA